MLFGERALRLADRLQAQRHAQCRDHFAGGDHLAESFAQEGQQADGLSDRGNGHQRGFPAQGAGKEFENGRGDNAQRALGPEKQLFQVIAGVVLAKAAQRIEDATVRQHDLETEDQITRHTEAQHRIATGIGGQAATDLCAAFAAVGERKEPVRLLGLLLDLGQDATGLDRHRVVEQIDLAHPVHALQGDQHLCATFIGHAAAAKAGIATDRHHDCPGVRAFLHRRCQLGGAGRAQENAGSRMLRSEDVVAEAIIDRPTDLQGWFGQNALKFLGQGADVGHPGSR
ncbi:MAG: hypothetical protein R3E83_20380 [Burkholderiaceae bacterium]